MDSMIVEVNECLLFIIAEKCNYLRMRFPALLS